VCILRKGQIPVGRGKSDTDQARAIRRLGLFRDDHEKSVVHRRLDAVVQARRAVREAIRSV
jgi:hypothetical protein